MHYALKVCVCYNVFILVLKELAENGTVDARGDPICIIHELCDLFDGISVEAKTIKEFWLRPKIKNMVEQGVSLVCYIPIYLAKCFLAYASFLINRF